MRIPTETEDIRNVQVATEIARAMKWKTALFRVKKATDVREFSCLIDSIIPPPRHFTILGQWDEQNMPRHNTIELNENTGWKRRNTMASLNDLNFVFFPVF